RSGENVEVAHESMFREWPRFRRWLELERQRLLTLRGLEGAAMNWVAKDRSVDELVHSGRRLRDVRRLVKLPHFKAIIDCGSEGREYLRAFSRNFTPASLISRFVAVAMPLQLLLLGGWIAFACLNDGSAVLPYAMIVSVFVAVMGSGIGVALFGTAVGLR